MLRPLLPHLPCFSAVANHQSFSAAARELALTQAAVSYQIRQLEEKLGFMVFSRRQGGGVELTERGTLLLQEYLLVERNMERVIEALSPNSSNAVLRMTAPVDFGSRLLVPLLEPLAEKGVTIELDLRDETVPFARSHFDMAIRSDQREAGLCYEPLPEIPNRLVCSKSYAQKAGRPITVEQLLTHQLLLRDRRRSRSWFALLREYLDDLQSLPNVRVLNNSYALFEAVKQNMGIALLPCYMVEESIAAGELFSLDLSVPATPFFLAFQPSVIIRHRAEKIRSSLCAIAACWDKPSR